MTDSLIFDAKIPKEVVEAFAPYAFSSWENVLDFILDQIQKYVGPLDETNPADFFRRTQEASAGPDNILIEAYKHLMAGAFHLDAVKHPFLQRTDTTLPEDVALVVIAPWGTGLRISAIYETLDIIREEGIDTDKGKQALDGFYGHVKLLKEIAPTTKLNTLWTGMPPVPLQPRVRGRLNELAILAFSGKTGLTVREGRVISLQ